MDSWHRDLGLESEARWAASLIAETMHTKMGTMLARLSFACCYREEKLVMSSLLFSSM